MHSVADRRDTGQARGGTGVKTIWMEPDATQREKRPVFTGPIGAIGGNCVSNHVCGESTREVFLQSPIDFPRKHAIMVRVLARACSLAGRGFGARCQKRPVNHSL